MKFTYYGHSCFSVEVKSKKILFDPFITPNELAKDINIADVGADYILHRQQAQKLFAVGKFMNGFSKKELTTPIR